MGSYTHCAVIVPSDDLLVPATDNPERLFREQTESVYAVKGEQRARDAALQDTDEGEIGTLVRPEPDSSSDQLVNPEGADHL